MGWEALGRKTGGIGEQRTTRKLKLGGKLKMAVRRSG